MFPAHSYPPPKGMGPEKVLRPHSRRLAYQHPPPRSYVSQVHGDDERHLAEGGDAVEDPVGSLAVGWWAWGSGSLLS